MSYLHNSPTGGGLRAIWAYRALVQNLVSREIKLSYRRMGLGVLWTLLNPLGSIVLYFLVFRYVLQIEPTTNFALFLTLGIIHWDLFNRIIIRSTDTMVQNAVLLDKVAFPRIVLPFAVSSAEAVQHLFAVVTLAIFFIPLGGTLWWGLLLYPLPLALAWIFCVGACFFLSAVTVAVRDLTHIVNIGMRAAFFASPILYDFSKLSPNLQKILLLNPIAIYLNGIRKILYLDALPTAREWIGMVVVAFAMLFIGRAVFLRMQGRFTEWL